MLHFGGSLEKGKVVEVWNSKKNTAEDILKLIESSYSGEEQDVQPYHATLASTVLLTVDAEIKVYSQAEAIVKAQELGLSFQSWMKVRLI